MGRTMLGELEHLLLVAVLRLEEGAYGAAIIEEVEERTGRELSHAACYIGLGRLEKKGLLVSREGTPTPERGGRPRKYFRLTRDGEVRLQESADALFRMWSGADAPPVGEFGS